MFENLNKKQNLVLPKEKKQRKLMLLLVAIVLAIAVLLFFYFNPISSEGPATTENISSFADQQQLLAEDLVEKIDFDISFLKNSFFQSLKVYGEWPLIVEQKGRANPFLPY